jgi:hypothetical protein
MKQLVIGLTVMTTCFYAGCFDLGPPSSADDVNSTWSRFDGFTLHLAGSDDTAWRLVRTHGWSIHEEHRGGQGDTLQIIDPSGGVVLIWAYNSFSGFVLSEGWTGQTANGARIGTTVSEFGQLHPEFTESSSERFEFHRGTARVTVSFDGELLSKIDVRDY